MSWFRPPPKPRKMYMDFVMDDLMKYIETQRAAKAVSVMPSEDLTGEAALEAPDVHADGFSGDLRSLTPEDFIQLSETA